MEKCLNPTIEETSEMMRLAAGKPKRDFNRYIPFTRPIGNRVPSINRYVPFAMFFMENPVVTDDWPDEFPVLEEEIRLLGAHFLELLPELTEFDEKS